MPDTEGSERLPPPRFDARGNREKFANAKDHNPYPRRAQDFFSLTFGAGFILQIKNENP
jgi:hypothetical protein